MNSPKHILSGIAIVLAVAGMIWPNNILVAAGVLLRRVQLPAVKRLALLLALALFGCATPTAPPKDNAVTRTGQDLTTLAAQVFQAYSDYKEGDKSYLWSINQGLTAYQQVVKTSADIKEVVKQFGDSKVDDATGQQRSLIDRLAILFNSSAALPEVKAAAIAKAAETVAKK